MYQISFLQNLRKIIS